MDIQNMAPAYLRELDEADKNTLYIQNVVEATDDEMVLQEMIDAISNLAQQKTEEIKTLNDEVADSVNYLETDVLELVQTLLHDIFSSDTEVVGSLRYKTVDGVIQYIYVAPSGELYHISKEAKTAMFADILEAHDLKTTLERLTADTDADLDELKESVTNNSDTTEQTWTSDATEQPATAETETTTQEADKKSIGDNLSDAWEAMKNFDFDAATAAIAAAFGVARWNFSNLFNRWRKSEDGGGVLAGAGSVFKKIWGWGKALLGQVAGLFGVELDGQKPVELAGIRFPSDLERMDAPDTPTVGDLLTGLVPDDYTRVDMVHALTNEWTNAREVLLKFQNTITRESFISRDKMSEYLAPVLDELLPILTTKLQTSSHNHLKEAAFSLQQKTQNMDWQTLIDVVTNLMIETPSAPYWETTSRAEWKWPVHASHDIMTMASLHNADSDNPTVEHLPLGSLITKLIYDLPAVLADLTVDDVDDEDVDVDIDLDDDNIA